MSEVCQGLGDCGEVDGPGRTRPDPLRRWVHVALAVYLLPVVVLVLAAGGVMLAGLWACDAAARGWRRLRGGAPRGGPPQAGGLKRVPGHHIARAGRAPAALAHEAHGPRRPDSRLR